MPTFEGETTLDMKIEIFGARDGRPVDRKQPSTTHQLSNKKVQQYYYHKKYVFAKSRMGRKSRYRGYLLWPTVARP